MYRGCLETMQDVEHIRSLGNKPQSAPVWTGSKADGGTEVEAETAEKEGDEGNTLEITGDTTLHRALQTISLPEGIPFTAFSEVQASFQSGAVCNDEPGGRFPYHRGKRRLYGRRAAWENKRRNNKEK